MNKNYFILPLVVVLVAGAFLAGQFTSMVSTPGALTQGVIHGGLTCYQITRADGTLEDLGCKHNLFMDEGKAFLADEIGTGNSTNCVDAMWVGNVTFIEGSDAANFDAGMTGTGIVWEDTGFDVTDCTGFYQGAWRDEGTGTGNISASCVWTATGAAVVSSTALNCSDCAATAEFFAVNNFTTTATLANNDQLNVTWYVWST